MTRAELKHECMERASDGSANAALYAVAYAVMDLADADSFGLREIAEQLGDGGKRLVKALDDIDDAIQRVADSQF